MDLPSDRSVMENSQLLKKPKNDDSSGLNDRVFICLGKLRETGQPHTWVMTLNRTYDQVTFWETAAEKKYVMMGRVVEGQERNLQAYLSPNLTEAEKKQIEKERELKRQESSLYQSEMEFEN